MLLFVASMGMCHFGIRSEIGKIPSELRARMSDTDWIGAEWATRPLFINIAAGVLFAIATGLWMYERRQSDG
jgi:hypothetical protein